MSIYADALNIHDSEVLTFIQLVRGDTNQGFEIGIRKVLGANVSSVVMLIAREFTFMIVLALVVATPVTWYLIAWWQQNFTLQATINPLQFLVAGISVISFAWATISFLSFRAATANPTKALRTE